MFARYGEANESIDREAQGGKPGHRAQGREALRDISLPHELGRARSEEEKHGDLFPDGPRLLLPPSYADLPFALGGKACVLSRIYLMVLVRAS